MASRAATTSEVGQAYFELHHQMHRVVEKAFGSVGLTVARVKVLMRLGECGPINQATLAARLGYAPRSVTDSVDALVRDGLVTRREDENDRRARIVELTPAGAKALKRAQAARLTVMDEIFGALSAKQRADLVELLEYIRSALPQAGEPCAQ